MGKKVKGPKFSTITTKAGETLRVFEDLDDFEMYLKNETEDDDFDHVHCRLKYYPPFILHESHDDPDKIKDTANCHSKKFVRHLHQHVEKHLLKDIREKIQQPSLRFKHKDKEETFDHIKWIYNDVGSYHEKDFEIHLTVECHNDSAIVDVDYLTKPLVSSSM